MIKKQNILIIGGTGFIGSYVTKNLSEKDNYVMVIHRQSLVSGQAIKGVIYQKDFIKNKKGLKNIETVVVASTPDPITLISILDYLSRASRVKKIVYLSTFGVYAESSKKLKETSTVFPESVYQKNKYYEEIALGQCTKRLGMKLCIARLSSVYGDIKNKEMINRIVRQLLYQEELVINGDGSQKRDFIFVEDAAELISYLAMRNQKSGYEVFNICSGRAYSINEAAAFLEEFSGKKLLFKCAPLPDMERRNSVGDNTKIMKASKYRMQYSFKNGLEKTLENYKRNS